LHTMYRLLYHAIPHTHTVVDYYLNTTYIMMLKLLTNTA
jgi:hypothetical protein